MVPYANSLWNDTLTKLISIICLFSPASSSKTHTFCNLKVVNHAKYFLPSGIANTATAMACCCCCCCSLGN